MKIKLTKDFRVVNYDRCRYSKKVYSTGEVTSFDDEDAGQRADGRPGKVLELSLYATSDDY